MFNPIECYCTEKFQYILIHKNGCSTIANLIVKNYDCSVNNFLHQDIPSFAVLRDPWERTISGLAYDLQRSFGDITEQILDNIDFYRMFYQPINPKQRVTGFISHTSIQTGYLFDITPTFYVDLKSLNNFLNIHFENYNGERRNEMDKNLKIKLIDIIEKRKDIKDTIEKYLSIDYYLFDRIRNTEILWDYSMGKMWN